VGLDLISFFTGRMDMGTLREQVLDLPVDGTGWRKDAECNKLE
jgi:hypothetical protein